jgi:hypothetical protein
MRRATAYENGPPDKGEPLAVDSARRHRVESRRPWSVSALQD